MSNQKLKLIPREDYIFKLKSFLDKPIIKVLVGMRRTGKSSLMRLIMSHLIDTGVDEQNIIYINKESLEFDFIKTYEDLYKYVKENFKNISGKKYLFIDEVQEIEYWEKAVNSFLAEDIADIIISGSNARIISSELASLLSGRFVEIPVYSLTFREFLKFRNNYSDIEEEFKNYIKYGGLPGIHFFDFNDEVVFTYLNSILNTILYKDILLKFNIRDTKTFDKIVRYVFDNIGSITTAKRITDYFKSQRLKISLDTVLNYVEYLEHSLIIDKVERYDLKGKKILEFYDKFYLNDIGLRNGLIGYRDNDISGLLENIVFNELKARGYKVKIGVYRNYEIDFIAEKLKEKKYIQVCYLIKDDTTYEREFRSLEKIDDNYEKIVISLDKFFPQEIKGIKHIYLLDFLLNLKSNPIPDL